MAIGARSQSARKYLENKLEGVGYIYSYTGRVRVRVYVCVCARARDAQAALTFDLPCRGFPLRLCLGRSRKVSKPSA